MPRNPEIKSVLLIGSGPIVIGQACEFDYSGSQAARSLRDELERVKFNYADELQDKDRNSREELSHLRGTIVALRDKLDRPHAE